MQPRPTPRQRATLSRLRAEHPIIADYLDALDSLSRPHRPRHVVRAELDRLDDEIRQVPPLEELLLLQRQRDLTGELEAIDRADQVIPLEADFITHAARLGADRGVQYDTWRHAGVPDHVLRSAGIEPDPTG